MDEGLVNIEDKIEELKSYFSGRSKILAVWITGLYCTDICSYGCILDFAVLYEGSINSIELIEDAGCVSGITGYPYVDLVNLMELPLFPQYKVITEGRLIFDSGSTLAVEYVDKLFYELEKEDPNL